MSEKKKANPKASKKTKIANIPELEKVSGYVSAGNTAGNIVNKGTAAFCDGWIYHNGHFGDELHKLRLNGSGNMKLNEHKSTYLNIVDGWIYYYSELGICKMRTDGSNSSILTTDESDCLNVVGDWIYFINRSNEDKIYRIRLDGTEKTMLVDHWADSLIFADGWLYYAIADGDEADGMFKMKPEGTEWMQLSKDTATYINTDGDFIYYSNQNDDGTIHKMMTDGSRVEKLNDDNSKYLNLAGDWIYYVDVDYDKELFKIRTDGSGENLIKDKGKYSLSIIDELNIVEDWVYFIGNTGIFDEVSCRVRTDGSGFSALVEMERVAIHHRVKFENGKSYIYRTLDSKIKLGSKVKVDGKMAGMIGEVVEEKPKFNRNAEAFYISEVISYGDSKEDQSAQSSGKTKETGYVKVKFGDRMSNQDFSFKKNTDGSYVIISYKGNDSIVEVPSIIGKTVVTMIGDYGISPLKHSTRGRRAQANRINDIKEIIIENGIKEIGKSAFANCRALERVIIPSSVKLINNGAFSHCVKLNSIVIPQGVSKIGDLAFYGCLAMKNISLPDTIKQIGLNAFSHCSSLEEIVIPHGVRTIKQGTFANCDSLEKIIMPDSISSIGFGAFANCTSLKNVVIPYNVNGIGDKAFEGCHSLVIKGRADTYAEIYANNHNITFESI